MSTRFTTAGSLLALTGAIFAAGCTDSSSALVDPSLRADVPVSATAAPSEFVLDYTKTESGPGTFNWFGDVSGDINGDLETSAGLVQAAGKIWHIATVWTVTNASGKEFVAELAGMLDTSSGRLVMNGEIVSGYLAGAQIHEHGQLTGFTGAGGTVFEGILRIMPGSAD